MKVDSEVLERLQCMHTSSPLRLVDAATLAAINDKVAEGTLRDSLGRAVSSPFETGLLNREGTHFYPIMDGVIQLLRDELVKLDSPPFSDKANNA